MSASNAGVFEPYFRLERKLAEFTGAPQAVLVDCCTHALELCLIVERVRWVSIPSRTYISVLMTLRKLGIYNTFHTEAWIGEYQLGETRIWDSARRLERGMYREKQLQCLSFGYDKPLAVGRGGAILLDDPQLADRLRKMRYDGRDISISPWQSQVSWEIGYHYRPTIEECLFIESKFDSYLPQLPVAKDYPDLQSIKIKQQ